MNARLLQSFALFLGCALLMGGWSGCTKKEKVEEGKEVVQEEKTALTQATQEGIKTEEGKTASADALPEDIQEGKNAENVALLEIVDLVDAGQQNQGNAQS
jgi:hypothetical protein